jgi:hypothetical protein
MAGRGMPACRVMQQVSGKVLHFGGWKCTRLQERGAESTPLLALGDSRVISASNCTHAMCWNLLQSICLPHPLPSRNVAGELCACAT